MDCGFYNLKLQGLFSKFTLEGVRGALDRWITDERPGLKERDEREGREARLAGAGGGCGGAAMVSGGKVAGVGRERASGHSFLIREHLEEEEDEASPSRGKTGPGERPARRSAAAPWPAPRSSWLGR